MILNALMVQNLNYFEESEKEVPSGVKGMGYETISISTPPGFDSPSTQGAAQPPVIMLRTAAGVVSAF